MAVPVQRRRGSTVEHSTFTGALGEVTVDTTKNVTVVHDGATPGGFPAASEGSIEDHTGDDSIHAELNDAGSALDELWSSVKVESELAEKVDAVTDYSLVQDSEIEKIHTQNTDTALDLGGVNTVSAAEVRAEVDDPQLSATGNANMFFQGNSTGDGFLTHSAETHRDALGAKGIMSSSIVYSIGSGGDFPTYNAALEFLTKRGPQYFAADPVGARVFLQGVAGFVMAEQILVDGINLSWISITGVDAETSITRSALTKNMEGGHNAGARFPAFGAIRGGVLPIIGQLFSMDSSGSASGRDGVYVNRGSMSVCLPGAGVKNAAERAFSAVQGSYQDNTGAIASFAGNAAFFSASSSFQNNQSSNGTSAGWHAYFAQSASTQNNANSDASYGAADCFRAHDGSYQNNTSGYTDWAVGYGAHASNGSHQNNRLLNAGTSLGIHVSAGSISAANLSSGDLTQTANTITANGIIFK